MHRVLPQVRFPVLIGSMETMLDILTAMGRMSFADFMRTALYHPELGYYSRRDRVRVGTRRDADFFTSESMGPVFAHLVAEAAWNLAAPFREEGAVFVEMGAEPGAANVPSLASSSFVGAVALRRGELLPAGAPVVLFSNELFDAQPFYRVVRRDGVWRECGVEVRDGHAVEILLEDFSEPVAAFAEKFPDVAKDGCRMDLPLEAEQLMRDIVSNRDVRAVIAFDYGLDWADVLYRRPAGTARAYRRHELVENLLADPGEQDLTCHICWDGLESVLKEAGFSQVSTVRQESFFMHHAAAGIESVLRRGDLVECGRLRELIHPDHLGSAFQALSAVRL